MADDAIVNTTVVTGSKDYTLTGVQEMLVKAVRASIDGSGAAGQYIPTLQMLAPNGTVMWSAELASPVAAGVSVDMNWFPGAGGGGATVTPSLGSITQSWYSTSPGANFNFNTRAAVVSNFPANTSFTKLTSTSHLLITFNGDFTPGGTPDTVTCYMTLDAAIMTAFSANISVVGGGGTCQMARTVKGIAAGVHTVGLNVASFNNLNCTLLSSNSCDMEIVEYEATTTS